MDISVTLIVNANLSKLDLYVSRPRYFEEKISRFTEILIKDKVQEIEDEPEVSNSKEEKKRQATLRKEERDVLATTRFSASCLHESSTTGLVSGLSAPFASVLSGSTGSAMSLPHLSALSALAGSARSAMLVPYLSVPSAFTWSAGSADPVFDLSAPFAFAGSAMPVVDSSTLSASTLSAFVLSTSSRSAIVVFGLSASAMPVFGLSAFF